MLPKAYPLQINAGLANSTMLSGMSTARRIVAPDTPETLPSPEGSDADTDRLVGETYNRARSWDVHTVCAFLESVGFGHLEENFRHNHISGEQLLELDKDVMRELGIKKVGERVRLYIVIKRLRNRVVNFEDDEINKVCCCTKNCRKENADVNGQRTFVTKNYPLEDLGGVRPKYQDMYPEPKGSSSRRAEHLPRQIAAYATNEASDSSDPQSPDIYSDERAAEAHNIDEVTSPDSARPDEHRKAPDHGPDEVLALDGASAVIPLKKGMMRVLYGNSLTKVVNISDCMTVNDATDMTLRKFSLPTEQAGNYCFWSYDRRTHGVRRLGDSEMWHMLQDEDGLERNGLMLQSVHGLEPAAEAFFKYIPVSIRDRPLRQYEKSRLDLGEDKFVPFDEVQAHTRSRNKIRQVLGEELDDHLAPLPTLMLSRRLTKYLSYCPPCSEDDADSRILHTGEANGEQEIRGFGALRPPSEMIASDLSSYFPGVKPEIIDRTVRQSVHLSQRLMEISGRASVASFASLQLTQDEAPPVPVIATEWLRAQELPPSVQARRLSRSKGVPMYGRESLSASTLRSLRGKSLYSVVESEFEDQSDVNSTTAEYDDGRPRNAEDANTEDDLASGEGSEEGSEEYSSELESDEETLPGTRHSREVAELVGSPLLPPPETPSAPIELGTDGAVSEMRSKPTVTRLTTSLSNTRSPMVIPTDEVDFGSRRKGGRKSGSTDTESETDSYHRPGGVADTKAALEGKREDGPEPPNAPTRDLTQSMPTLDLENPTTDLGRPSLYAGRQNLKPQVILLPKNPKNPIEEEEESSSDSSSEEEGDEDINPQPETERQRVERLRQESTREFQEAARQEIDKDMKDGNISDLTSFLDGKPFDDGQWIKGGLIGRGTYGNVYLALHSVTGELLAVKQVDAAMAERNPSPRKKAMIQSLRREMNILRELRHPNIVQYMGCSSTDTTLNIFLEYVSGGCLQKVMDDYGALGEPMTRSFTRQILTGLDYLHAMGIVHRDIKGANILVDNTGAVKISDFGVSKRLDPDEMMKGAINKKTKKRFSIQGSVFWMAPEVVKQKALNDKADVWALAVLVVEMLTGGRPFESSSQLQTIFQLGVKSEVPRVPPSASPMATDFLELAFTEDYKERPGARELLMQPWLRQYTDD